MPAARYDIALEQGATYQQTITWRNPPNPDGTQGTAIDLTGHTAHMQIRTSNANSAPGTPLLDLTSGAGGGLVLGGTAGTIQINITAAQTAALNFVRAAYDLYVTKPDGTVLRLLEGAVTIDLTVTVN